MSELTISESINHALKQAFAAQPNLILLETKTVLTDTPTEGLQQLYGKERVIITPQLSGITGIAIGMASNKIKPILHITNNHSIYHVISQLNNYANDSQQQKQHSIIIHAQAPQAHETIPLIKDLIVVTPATPADAHGLYLSALTSLQPVLFLEPARIMHTIREEIIEETPQIPIGKASIIQEGTELTIITWGASVQETKKALHELPQYSAEIINLRTLSPFDKETVLESVKKTSRAIIIEEGQTYNSYSTSIAASIQENAFNSLKAPVLTISNDSGKEDNLTEQLASAIKKIMD